MLACKDVAKSYGAFTVLSECSIAVKEGSCTLISGPSGGGKSTLLRILALIEPADSGQVKHGGRTVAPMTLGALERTQPPFPFLTVVFQQIHLWPHLTVKENIAVVLMGNPHHPLDEATTGLLERFGVAAVVDLRPHECSLGQRQRVAIARAILMPTRFVLLDEPASALDHANRLILARELAKVKATGRGMLIVSHHETEFDTFVDSHLELENGVLRRPAAAGRPVP